MAADALEPNKPNEPAFVEAAAAGCPKLLCPKAGCEEMGCPKAELPVAGGAVLVVAGLAPNRLPNRPLPSVACGCLNKPVVGWGAAGPCPNSTLPGSGLCPNNIGAPDIFTDSREGMERLRRLCALAVLRTRVTLLQSSPVACVTVAQYSSDTSDDVLPSAVRAWKS